MLMIPVDFKSARALYLQIADHITALARNGQLKAGSRLPASRNLADQLQIHRSTVVNAYEELKARGVIDSHQGSGTYIAPGLEDSHFSPRSLPVTRTRQPEELLAELWQLNRTEGVISLALGHPPDDMIPIDEFEQLRARVLRRDRGIAYNYEDPQGYYPLRVAIAGDLARHGIIVGAEDVIVTFGGQEGLSLVARAFAAAGDTVLTEMPTFFSTLFNLNRLCFNLLGFDLGTHGPDWPTLVRHLEPLLAGAKDDCPDCPAPRPRFAHVTPDHQNPTGIQWSMEDRYRFLRGMSELDIPIVEDATYRDLTFDTSSNAVPLRALDARVVYIGSFSKSLTPGLRIGFVVASGALREHLTTLKMITSGPGETLGQRTLAEYLQEGRYTHHLTKVHALYCRRRDVMLDAMDKYFPPEARWVKPMGGYYIWVQLDAPLAAETVYREALERGIVIAPASIFYMSNPPGSAFRLSFVRSSEEMIVYAIRSLGTLLDKLLARGRRLRDG